MTRKGCVQNDILFNILHTQQRFVLFTDEKLCTALLCALCSVWLTQISQSARPGQTRPVSHPSVTGNCAGINVPQIRLMSLRNLFCFLFFFSKWKPFLGRLFDIRFGNIFVFFFCFFFFITFRFWCICVSNVKT